MKNIYILILLLSCLYGCSSIERDRQRFVEYHNFKIGRPFEQYALIKPEGKEYITNENIKYLFKYNDCVWWILVEDEIILKWGVVSNPGYCVIESGFAP